MELAGVAVAFGSIMYLISKSVSLGLAFLIGTGIVGLFAGLGLQGFLSTVLQGIFDPMTMQLVIAVVLISGLGKLMKESGDLSLMVGSLVAIFRNPKMLSMMLPALVGTLNVPGGAIMSTPMVEENGKILGLDATTKSAINVFSRHIGYFVYPLYASTIILSELLDVQKLVLIRHNVITMLVGIAVAYLSFFRGVGHQQRTSEGDKRTFYHIKCFLSGFSPILTALGLVLFFETPFYIAVTIGVALGLVRGLPAGDRRGALIVRLRKFFTEWIDYRLVLTITGLMAFKAVIEASGVVGILADILLGFGIPLPMIVVIMGLIASLLTGAHMAAAGILATLFAPLFPVGLVAPYTSLLFTTIMLGYLVSPIHLCLVLTNQYFGVKYPSALRKLLPPVLVMMAVAVVQLLWRIR